ncbi:MAG: elongation factor Tu [Rhodothermaceae bacterium]|nr:elongation factor Tu [Rhodothermaceae bacterium]
MVPTEEGGRRSPAFSGYRPSHDFGRSDGLNDAQHEYPDDDLLHPGETGRALLRLLAPDLQHGRLFEGMTFTVQEGSRIVGYGMVTRIHNEALRRAV